MANRDFSDIPYLFVGAVVAAQEEVERFAETLVEKGKSLTPEGRKKAMSAKKGLVSKGDDFSQVVGRTVQRVLENSGIATGKDFETLDARVSEIEGMVTGRVKKPAGKKPAKKKSVRKKPAKKKSAAGKPAAAKGAKVKAVKKTAVKAPPSAPKPPAGNQ